MNDSESQARSIAQHRLLSAEQVTSLFQSFQRDRLGSSDFCEFLEQQSLITPIVASQVRASSRPQPSIERNNPLDVNTQCVNTAAIYHAQDHSGITSVEATGTYQDFTLQGAVQSGPENLGPYTLLSELGRGGMGVVYHALDTKLGREVALKMLRPEDAADLVALERFEIEAQALARLHHPHIIEVYSIDKFQGMVCMAMPLIKGGALSEKLKQTEQLDFCRALDICQKVALGLAHAHERNIIHRDLKPDNILLTEEGEPVITDFGLAKAVDSQSTGVSKTGEFLGTVAFTSPEQIQGSRAIDGRADVFSLGVTLFLMLTSRLPFQGASNIETVKHILRSPAPRLSQYRDGIPEELEVIVARCLCKDPDDRYESALALADDCSRWLLGEQIQASPVSFFEGVRKGVGDTKSVAIFSVLFLLMVGLLGFGAFAVTLQADREQLEQEKRLAEAERENAQESSETLRRKVAELVDQAAARERDARRQKQALIAGHALGMTAFQNAKLSGVDFSRMTMKQGRFSACLMDKTLFREAVLDSCQFIKCQLTAADFTGALIKKVRFIEADLRECCFDSVDWRGGSYDSKTRWPEGFDPREHGLKEVEASNKPSQKEPKKKRAFYKDGRGREEVYRLFSKGLAVIRTSIGNRKYEVAARQMLPFLMKYRETLSQESPKRLGNFHRLFGSLLTRLRKQKSDTWTRQLISNLPAKFKSRYQSLLPKDYRPSKEGVRLLEKVYSLFESGKLTKSLTLCKSLVSKEPELKPIFVVLSGYIADRQGDYQSAISYFTEYFAMMQGKAFLFDRNSKLARWLGTGQKYRELASTLKNIETTYDTELVKIQRLAKNEVLKRFLKKRGMNVGRTRGLPLRKKGLFPYVLERHEKDEMAKVGQTLDRKGAKFLGLYQSIVDRSPSYVPGLIELSIVHKDPQTRKAYALSVLDMTCHSPELISDEDFLRVTKALDKGPALKRFTKLEKDTTRLLDNLLQLALNIRAYCLGQTVIERIQDRVMLPSKKRSYRTLFKLLTPIPFSANLVVVTKAKAQLKINGVSYTLNGTQAQTSIKIPSSCDFELTATAESDENKGIALAIQLYDGRFFYLSPRHSSEDRKTGEVTRLTAFGYTKIGSANLPLCWNPPKSKNDPNKTIWVRQRLDFFDFRHYENYAWIFNKKK